MKILYGIQGTGNGHLTRSRIIAREFAKYPEVEVTYLLSGRDKDKCFDMEVFGNNVIYKKGLSFVVENGKINKWKTIKNADITQLLKDIDHINVHDYDLVISDYEPIVAWACKCQNKPCIGIGHQYAFNYKIPKKGNFIEKWIMKQFAPVSTNIGLHWQHFDQPIFPPIIEQIENNLPFKQKTIISYLLFEDLQSIVNLYTQFPNTMFRIYDNRTSEYTPSNVQIFPLSKDAFLNDIKSCDGVICNAGFELASECIHLGKKLLVKPVEGQMEQESNAYALNLLGFGQVVNKFTFTDILKWLTLFTPLEKIPQYPNVAEYLVKWLLGKNGFDTIGYETLSKVVWEKVNYDR